MSLEGGPSDNLPLSMGFSAARAWRANFRSWLDGHAEEEHTFPSDANFADSNSGSLALSFL